MVPKVVCSLRVLTQHQGFTKVPLSTHRFINARRRILQPMLDSSCSETPKTKKKTAQNRPVQRFWPDSIASGVAQPPPSELTMSEGMQRCRPQVKCVGGRPRSAVVSCELRATALSVVSQVHSLTVKHEDALVWMHVEGSTLRHSG
jgi:hypothetical protein